MSTAAIAAVIVVLVLVIAIFAYEKGYLNKVLPEKWQKPPKVAKASFVGAYSRYPAMQQCLMGNHNRCTHV